MIKRKRTGGSTYIWTYSDPVTGAWKLWWAAQSTEAGSFVVEAVDETYPGPQTLTVTPQTVTYSGTADITGITFSFVSTPISGYDIYGFVRTIAGDTASGVNGALIRLHNTVTGAQGMVYTANDGTYEGAFRFYNCDAGSYVVQPTYPGATFVPTYAAVTVTTAAVNAGEFIITLGAGHKISGTLTCASSDFDTLGKGPMAVWATEATSGLTYVGTSAATGATRAWTTSSSVPDGTYSVGPVAIPGGTWDAADTVVLSGADGTSDAVFTPTATGSASIAGTVTLNAAVFAGVTIALRSGSSVTGTLLQETTTDTSGDYSFATLANGTYTVVPAKTGYVFSPSSLTVAITGASADNDFTAAISSSGGDTYTISGLCYQGISTGVPGVLVTAGSYSATTDAYGIYAITGVPVGTYTIRASKINYTWTAHGFTNPVTVGYGNVEDIDWLGTGGTGGGGGGSDVAVPYIFTNAHDDYAESVDADKLNANFDTLADAVNNISDANVAESAGIDPAKTGSSLGKANLEADILDMDARIEEVLEVDPDFIKYAMLPCDEDGIEISGGADGSVTVGAGKHLLLMGKRFELAATTLPEDGTLAAQSVYALRAKLTTADDVEDDDTLTEGDLMLYAVPLAGNALGSGDTGSTKYTVAQVTGATSGSKFTISGQGSAPLIGAYMVSLDSSYEKAFIAYNSGGTVMLADALGASPATDSRIGICIDDPDYDDDPGSLGGVSTPDDALLAIIYCGSTGETPYVQKMIPRNYETLGKARTISSSWSARTVLSESDEPGYDEVQLTLPTTITAPAQVVSIMAVLYDTESSAPTDGSGIFFGPMASIAFKVPTIDYPKGLEMRVTPEKIVARFAKGKLRILSNAADEGVAVKSACFKAVVTI